MIPLFASVAAALAPMPAGAQSAPPVEQRIDSVFENLPENPVELAVPLSRRALAKRASVLPYVPEESPQVLEGFARVEKPAPPRAPEQTTAAPAEPDTEELEEGSAEAERDEDAVRLPRPRPDPMARSTGPIDLVAAPAAPSAPPDESDLLAGAADSEGEEEPARKPIQAAAARLPKPAEPSREADPAKPGPEAPTAKPGPAAEPGGETAEPAAAPAMAAQPDAAPVDKAEPAAEQEPAVTAVAKAPLPHPEPLPQPDPATVAALGAAPDDQPAEEPQDDAGDLSNDEAADPAQDEAADPPLEDAADRPQDDADPAQDEAADQPKDEADEDQLDTAQAAWVPPPRPDREGDKPKPAGAKVVSVAARPAGPCLTPDKAADRDDDFSRNAKTLSQEGFCITQATFKERKRPWTVQTVTSGRPGPLWAVLHDDENDSFDTAVHALQTYGGVLVTLETGGKRNQDGIDPNRNFSDAEISCPKLGKSATPKFTAVFKDLIDPAQPIVALHNNFDGPVPTKGLGHVSMTTVPKDMRKVASKDPDGALAGEHALVLLAAAEPVSETAKTRMQTLAGRGLNVVLEPVREGKGDCSLSNYAVLSGHEDYFNVTVHHDEGEKQRKMIDAIMEGFPTVSASR